MYASVTSQASMLSCTPTLKTTQAAVPPKHAASRDNLPAIESRDSVLLGLSPDSPGSHQKFIAKHELNFTLLSDPEHKLLEALGAWGEKEDVRQDLYGCNPQHVRL